MGCATSKPVNDISTGSTRLPFPLSDYQKCILKDTWAYVERNKLEFGVNVFISLLEKYPAMLNVFPEFSKLDDLHEMCNWTELQGHPMKITSALSRAIATLDDGALFISQLEQLGGRHQTRNLEPEHLAALGESIMLTLPLIIPEDRWDADSTAAWKDLYNFVCKTMKIGLNKAQGIKGNEIEHVI